MVFAGTLVTAGRAKAVVVATGGSTEIGRIAALTRGAPRTPTPLERRLQAFSRSLFRAAIGIFVLVTGFGMLRGIPFADIFLIALSEMVSMVPEGLPIAWTVALAVGSQRISRRGAIIRKLSAVETLGSVDVICTDKTGTLTRNEMTVTRLVLPSGKVLTASGTGFSPEGRVSHGDREETVGSDTELRALVEAATLCNDAQLSPPTADGGAWRALGDPTEAALLTFALKAGANPTHLRISWPRHAEIPFDSSARWMLTQHTAGPLTRTVAKGAPESMLPLCLLDEAAAAAVRQTAATLACERLRVLAVAQNLSPTVPAAGCAVDQTALRGRMHFLGLIAQMDPPREESRGAVAACLAAGILPVMVTGDHADTAAAVARALGILEPGHHVLEGRHLDALSDRALAARLPLVRVFARVHPEQKLRIVRAYQAAGHVVAMTGDGVNDAPALACADVGIAMGKSGTEVAKQASRMILADDRFETIVHAAAEGRLVLQNLRKVLLFLFATSIDEVLLLLLCLVCGLPLPLTALQILWINIVTEGVVTVNLILEEAEGDEMQRLPHSPQEPLITAAMRRRLGLMASTSTVVCLGYFLLRLEGHAALETVQSEMFTLVTLCQWFNVLNCRSATRSSLRMSLLRNPWLAGGLLLAFLLQAGVLYVPTLNVFFHTQPIPGQQLLLLAAVASPVLWIEEIRKLLARPHRRSGA
jgi:Ca2+-transporting ATPase